MGTAEDVASPVLFPAAFKHDGNELFPRFEQGVAQRASAGVAPFSFRRASARFVSLFARFERHETGEREKEQQQGEKNKNIYRRYRHIVSIPQRTGFVLAGTEKEQYSYSVAVLYIVGTPIGNLSDITLRALETFKTADVIACEDTRHTLQLLTHFGIRKPLVSCRAQNEQSASAKIVKLLDGGQTVAYASDAGTPGISDPGAVLVSAARGAGHTVVPVPGASAFAVLMSAAGACGKTVVFEGFLSPKPGRRRSRLRELFASGWGFVLYESPFRIVKLLTDIADIDSGRRVVVGRELTKMHEEILEGPAEQIRDEFAHRDRVLGEFSVFVAGRESPHEFEKDADIHMERRDRS